MRDHEAALREAGLDLLESTCSGGFSLVDRGRTDIYEALLSGGYVPLEQLSPWVTDEMRASFHPAFRKYDLSELSAIGIHLVGRKPAAQHAAR